MVEIRFTLNGDAVSAAVSPAGPALALLRDTFGLTGTKPGCGEGECGACTILLDGEAVVSCLLPAALLDGREVVTIEGLEGPDGALHPVARAFVEAGAVQCGFCTPGMIMRTVAFLRERERERALARPRAAADGEVARAIEGNLCRCTGYVKILEAIRAAAREAVS